MSEPLLLTEREVSEIRHAIFYADECHHGTTGHNQLMLLAKLARHLGIEFDYESPNYLTLPVGVGIEAREVVASPVARDDPLLDWERARVRLATVTARYEALRNTLGVNVNFALSFVIYPLKKRFEDGERSRDLYDAIMGLK